MKTRRGSVDVIMPHGIDTATRNIIVSTMKQTTRKNQEQAIERIDFLMSQIDILLHHLKREKKHDERLEYLIRELAGANLMKGIELGKKYAGGPEELLSTITHAGIDVSLVLEALPKGKKKLAEFVIQSMQIGRLAFETGLAVSAFINLDRMNAHMEDLERQSSIYFG